MNVKILLSIFLLNCLNLVAQKTTPFEKKHGILVFEGKENIYSMYFIETNNKYQAPWFGKKDTIKIINLGSPGDNSNNTNGYKEYLNKNSSFDSLISISILENDKGLYIEDTCRLYYINGYINYSKSKTFKLEIQYEKKRINNKYIIYEAESFIPIKSFVPENIKIKKRTN